MLARLLHLFGPTTRPAFMVMLRRLLQFYSIPV
jgi:hypothetical protein